jgi:hypothetical protein
MNAFSTAAAGEFLVSTLAIPEGGGVSICKFREML